MKKRIFYSLLAASLLTLTATAQRSIQLRTESDSISYMMGQLMGYSISEANMPDLGELINPDIFQQAFMARLNGQPMQATDDEAIEWFTEFMASYQSRAWKDNKEAGERFLAENARRSGVVVLPSGLQYQVIQEGNSSERPRHYDDITMAYKGMTVDGKVFDEATDDEPSVTYPAALIDGMTEGTKLMTPGSKYIFYIPYNLAYGESGNSKIDPYSALIFEVHLISFEEDDNFSYDDEGNVIDDDDDYSGYEDEDDWEENIARGRRFLAENALCPGVTTTDSGLQFEVIQPGDNSRRPRHYDDMTIAYTVKSLDGDVVEEYTEDDPEYTYPAVMMDGLTEGMKLMTEGSKYRFYIPYDLAYEGERKRNLDPYSTVIVDMHLISYEEDNNFFYDAAGNVIDEDDYHDQDEWAEHMAAGQRFLAENALRPGVTVLPSGLQYEVIYDSGSGGKPRHYDDMTIAYTAKSFDGKVAEEHTEDDPEYTYPSAMIDGLTEGMKLMNTGSKFRFYLPYELAYGSRRKGNADPYSAIVVDMHLISFTEDNDFYYDAAGNVVDEDYYDEELEEQYAENKAAGERFLAQNTLRPGVTMLPSGLQYEVIRQGHSPEKPRHYDDITVAYKITNINGDVIEEHTASDPDVTYPATMIDGLTEGTKLMTPGSVFKFYIPQNLAYGARSKRNLEPFSAIIVEMELISFEEDNNFRYDRHGNVVDDDYWDEELAEEYADHIAAGERFLEENGHRPGVTTLPNGMQYEIIQPGHSDERPRHYDDVKISYEVRTTDDVLVDKKWEDDPDSTYPAAMSMKGMAEGVKLMTPGSVYRFYIPYDLAYGGRAKRDMEPFSVAVVEMKLISFTVDDNFDYDEDGNPID